LPFGRSEIGCALFAAYLLGSAKYSILVVCPTLSEHATDFEQTLHFLEGLLRSSVCVSVLSPEILLDHFSAAQFLLGIWLYISLFQYMQQ